MTCNFDGDVIGADGGRMDAEGRRFADRRQFQTVARHRHLRHVQMVRQSRMHRVRLILASRR